MAKNKSKSTKTSTTSSLRQLLPYCRPYTVLLAISVLFAICGTFLQIITPDFFRKITDEISQGLPQIISGNLFDRHINLDEIIRLITLTAGLYLVSFILTSSQSLCMIHITQKISFYLREDISQKINRIPLSYFDRTNYGDILSRLTNDVDTITQNLVQSFSQLISALILLIGTLALMFYNNWILALAAIFSSLLGFFLMMVIMLKSQKFFSSQQKQLGEVNGYIEEMFAGHQVVKAYGYATRSEKIFAKENDKLYESAWKSQFLSSLLMPLMDFMGKLTYVTVCVIGSILVVNGSIAFGVIIAFLFYARMFSQPLNQLGQIFNSLQRIKAATDRVFAFLNEEELRDESQLKAKLAADQMQGAIEFDHVNFSYVPEKTIIKDFSLAVKPGQKIAIVGPTGAGKTTLVNLLMRFYEVNSGTIKIDGISHRSLSRHNVHRLFSMVLQDTWLFEGSIYENIVFGQETISHDTVRKVCQKLGLDHYLSSLPQAYDTILNEHISLSEGQKQLLTIARAMVNQAPLLIFDEATSNVDTRTEQLVQDALSEMSQGRTSFVIAHRLSTIKNADLILVLKDGDIIEIGKHEELLQRQGFYAQLYMSQFRGNDSV